MIFAQLQSVAIRLWLNHKWKLTAATVCLFMAVIFAKQLAVFPAKLICICESDNSGAADQSYGAVIVMMGNLRMPRIGPAVHLVKAEKSQRIHLVQPEPFAFEKAGLMRAEDELVADLLVGSGVQRNQVHQVRGPGGERATSSWEEARYHRAYLEALLDQQPTLPRRIVLVTDWYHTSRALWIFRKVFNGSGIVVEAQPVGAEWVEKWWTEEDAFLAVFNEYLKWAYYLVKY